MTAGESLDHLAATPIWMPWREEPGATGKPTKVPYAARGTGKGSSTDPATWGTRRQAEARERMSGVGIALGPLPDSDLRLIGVDLDTCRDPKTQRVEPWARDVMRAFGSYAEVSPSRTGVKILALVREADMTAIRAALGAGREGISFKRGTGEHPPAIEFYAGKRWFAVTGKAMSSTPKTLSLVPRETVLKLLRETGPAFAGKSTGSAVAASRKPLDNTRSGRAFRLAMKVRRDGGSRADFEERLSDDDELAAWAEDARQVERAWTKSAADDDEDDGFAVTQDGAAQAFRETHQNSLRFDHSAGAWFGWQGTHWRRDEQRRAFHYAREISRDVGQRVKNGGTTTGRAPFAEGVEKFARADPAFSVTAEIWNRDPWLMGTPGGTVVLRTGKVRPASPEDHITRMAGAAPVPADTFDPDVECRLWLKFLRDATGNDAEMIEFLQRLIGYCLTGDTCEHILAFIYGPGGNGKSTFINVVAAVLGDYATTAAMETFTSSKFDRHSTELAMLRDARVVTASETEANRAWAESRLKQMTGGDPITARFMRQDNFTFTPAFKLLIIGNHKPRLENVDDAMRRRLIMIPFERQPERIDKELGARLRKEHPAILRWAIEGCLEWQRIGLAIPPAALAATRDYFADQDIFAQWLDARVERVPGAMETSKALAGDFNEYARMLGERVEMTAQAMGARMREKGFAPAGSIGPRRLKGIAGARLFPIDPDDSNDSL